MSLTPSLIALPWALLHRRGFRLQLSEMQNKQIPHAQDRSQLWMPFRLFPLLYPYISTPHIPLTGCNRRQKNTEFVSDATSRLRTNAALKRPLRPRDVRH